MARYGCRCPSRPSSSGNDLPAGAKSFSSDGQANVFSAHGSPRGRLVKPLRIWLVGTGTVGTWLAGVLSSQRERLAARYGLDATVVGVASARGGFVA